GGARKLPDDGYFRSGSSPSHPSRPVPARDPENVPRAGDETNVAPREPAPFVPDRRLRLRELDERREAAHPQASFVIDEERATRVQAVERVDPFRCPVPADRHELAVEGHPDGPEPLDEDR